MDYNKIIEDIYTKVLREENKGQRAQYIPELAKVNPDRFGIHLMTIDNQGYGIGDYQKPFSIQSIAKVLTLTLLYRRIGSRVWQRVGVEPSGNAFNSLMQLENENGVPRNPFINAGAIVISDMILSEFENPKQQFLDLVRDILDDDTIDFCEAVASSESSVGFRNIALCNYLKSLGNIRNNTAEVLDFYFNICSLKMTCKDLSKAFLYLANSEFKTRKSERVLSLSQAKRVNAIMQTCGFYDESGEFTFRVGLPGKSGVGGGVIAVHPGKYCIAVWSPRLNIHGNSYRGMKFLEQFTTDTKLSIF